MYLEGDASMRQYDDAEGKKQYRLNIVQRMLPFYFILISCCLMLANLNSSQVPSRFSAAPSALSLNSKLSKLRSPNRQMEQKYFRLVVV